MNIRTFGFISGLLGLVVGCADLKPDSFRVGGGVRRVGAKYGPIKFDENIPFVRVQANKKLYERVEGRVWVDGIQGNVGTTQYSVRGEFTGNVESVGTGVSYYPFSRNLSFDLGAEILHADGDVTGKMSRIGREFHDEVIGWGVNFGVTGECPVTKRVSVFVSGGYSFTHNWTSGEGLDYDFDGAYGFIGLKIELPNNR